MEIKNYKTKFNLEDVVWFMYDNKPSQGIIHRIKYTQEEMVDTRCRYKDIFHKIKSFLRRMNEFEKLVYEMRSAQNEYRRYYNGCCSLS